MQARDLAVILDLFSRCVVSEVLIWRNGTQSDQAALEAALQRRARPFHILRHKAPGQPYARDKCQVTLKAGVDSSGRSQQEDCQDNAVVGELLTESGNFKEAYLLLGGLCGLVVQSSLPLRNDPDLTPELVDIWDLNYIDHFYNAKRRERPSTISVR